MSPKRFFLAHFWKRLGANVQCTIKSLNYVKITVTKILEAITIIAR